MTIEPIDSRQLQIFVQLANKGKLSVAAKELGLTASAISHSLRSLEESLGTQLFHRTSKLLRLNEQGEYFLQEADGILNHMRRVRIALSGKEQAEAGRMRVATGYNFFGGPLPQIIREWKECFPKGNVLAQAAERKVCLELLKTDAADFSILVDPPADTHLEPTPLFEDELRMLVSSDNPLALVETVTLRQLHQKTLLVQRVESYTTRLIVGAMRQAGFSFRNCIEVGGVETLTEMVKVGVGIALMPNWAVPHASEDVALARRSVEGLAIRRKWAFVRKKGAPSSFMSTTFMRLCQQACERYSFGESASRVPSSITA